MTKEDVVIKLSAEVDNATKGMKSVADSVDKVGMSAKQTASALRQVPMQFTDIFTSLAAGQAPLQVFLQQGGQLKDLFGGAAPAAKALGSYIAGLINPTTVLSAAVVGLGAAYLQGSKESEQFRKSLILSGNAAGMSSGALSDMAIDVSKATRSTIGSAAETLNSMVGSGSIAADQFGKVAAAAQSMQRVAGISADETVKQFAELGKDPVNASNKLNSAIHYLNAEQALHIKTLADLGDKSGAAKVAQEAYADALNRRIPDLQNNLGLLSKSWLAIVDPAKQAWDAMLNIGREDSPEQKIAKLQAKIRDAYLNRAYNPMMSDAEIFNLQKAVTYWSHIAESQRDQAAYEKLKADQSAASIRLMQSSDEYASKQVRMQREIAQAQNDYNQSAQTASDLDAYRAKVIGIQAKYAETSKAAAKAQTDEQKRVNDGLALYNDLTAQANGYSKALTEDVTKLAYAYQHTSISAAEYQAALQQRLDAEPAAVASAKAMATAIHDAATARDKYLASVSDEAKQLEIENAGFNLSAQALADLTAARALDRAALIEMQAIKAMDRNLDYEAYDAQMRLAEAIRANAANTSAKPGIEAAKDLAKANKKAAEESAKYWEDALMRAFESGKGFFESLWSTIKNTLQSQVLKVSIQAFMGGAGFGAAGAATAGTLSAGSPFSVAGTLSNLYSAVSGGFSSIGASFGVEIGKLGAELATSTNASIQSLGQTLVGNYAAIGSAAGLAAAGLTGISLGSMLSDGRSLLGMSGSTTSTIGAALGSFFGPAGSLLGGVAGGALSGIFGSKSWTEAAGTQGTFSGSGFTGQSYVTTGNDPGLFGRNYHTTEYSALSAAQVNAWSSAFAALKVSATSSAAALGLATSGIDSYTKTIDIAAGSTEEQIAAVFKNMADEMATAMLPGITDLAKVGESASDTLSRLSSSLTTVNQWFDAFGRSLYDIGAAGADAASTLADAFGGLDKLNASSQAFYETYYTDGERAAQSQQNLTKALQLVNQTLPASKAAFRDVVTGLDLTTESGRSAYAVMLSLAPEFANLQDALTASAKTLQEAIDQLRGDQLGSASAAQLAARFGTNYSAAMAGDTAAATALAKDLPDLVNALKASASSREEWMVSTGRIYAQGQAVVNHLTGVPGFASGGVFGGGLRVVGEVGPEIELTGPSRIFNANDTAAILRGGGGSDALQRALLTKFEKLESSIDGLRQEMRSVAGHASTTASILRRVTPGGDAVATRAIA